MLEQPPCDDTRLNFVGAFEDGEHSRVYQEARSRGAYLRPLGNVVYVTPSLTIPDDDLDELLAVMQESVRVVAGSL